MKGLKKLALATAVAAAPFAQAELTAMDDSLLADMTGQAGITIDVDLQMTIDAIKYVDDDGATRADLDLNGDGDFLDPDEEAVLGAKGAITAKGLTIGSIDEATGDLSTASIRGVTIDADGDAGLTIGFGKIGTFGVNDNGTAADTTDDFVENVQGLDIKIDAVMINAGNANLAVSQAITTADTAYTNAALNGLTLADYKSGAATVTLTTTFDQTAMDNYVAAHVTNNAEAIALGFESKAQFDAVYGNADPTVSASAKAAVVTAAATEIGTQLAGGPAASAEAGALAATGDVGNLQTAGAVGDALRDATGGNVGGFIIEDFRNYIEDSLVEKYNDVFSMALQNSEGGLQTGATMGRYVRGELNISGTGSYDSVNGNHSGGLAISGKFGGAIDKAAWVDGDGAGNDNEFGVKDLGFFHGVDTVDVYGNEHATGESDGIADVIEGMHFSMNIDVVEHTSAVETATQVSALAISDMKMEGTIMMGNIYLGGTNTQERSLGSVLVKDIDMTGTTVYIYGH